MPEYKAQVGEVQHPSRAVRPRAAARRSSDGPGVLNLGQSADPELEDHILHEVGSYGRQIGRISDALGVLLKHSRLNRLNLDEQAAIEAFSQQLAQVKHLKHWRAEKDRDEQSRSGIRVHIHYSGQLAPQDLDTVLSAMNTAIILELVDEASGKDDKTAKRLLAWFNKHPDRSFIGIGAIGPGSIIMELNAALNIFLNQHPHLVGMSASLLIARTPPAKLIFRGLAESELPKEIMRLGHITGQRLAGALRRFNDWIAAQPSDVAVKVTAEIDGRQRMELEHQPVAPTVAKAPRRKKTPVARNDASR